MMAPLKTGTINFHRAWKSAEAVEREIREMRRLVQRRTSAKPDRIRHPARSNANFSSNSGRQRKGGQQL